jgi:DNA processing protein
MAEHGSAQASLEALPEIAAEAGLTNYEVFSESAAVNELKRGKSCGAVLIAAGEKTYPQALSETGDAPPLIWVRGNLECLQRSAVALVGARNASSLGIRMAKRLAHDLGAAGHLVISGLARGIDTAAHIGALKCGTAAVLAGGVDVIYPAENAGLAADIVNGASVLISEVPMGVQPRARDFPRRNRLVSGLAQAVVVVEAAAKSGSLITAKNALDQGREVLAVPGHPFDGRASGCLNLIRDGARLVRGADDVIEILTALAEGEKHEEPAPQPTRTLRETAALHQQILSRLGPSPVAEDQLIRDLGARASEVSTQLVSLELEGRILRAPGGLISLKAEAAH